MRDEFDELPNAFCYGIYIDGRLVSSLRLHHVTREHKVSPSYSVFPDVLDPLLEAGHTFIDPGRFTADLEASLAYPALPFLTLRIAVMAVWHFRVKYCLSTVRPEHVAFYRRVFNSTKLGRCPLLPRPSVSDGDVGVRLPGGLSEANDALLGSSTRPKKSAGGCFRRRTPRPCGSARLSGRPWPRTSQANQAACWI